MKIKESKGDRTLSIILNIFLVISLLLVIYPLIYVLSSSVSSAESVFAGKVWLLPVDFSLEGYKAVFRNNQIMTGYLNSFIYMIGGTIISLILTLMAAFPLSRKELVGKKLILTIFMIPMFISGGLIPSYLLIQNLGLLNTRWAIILPGALSMWNIVMVRTYMTANIPDELYESAQLDGCSDIGFLLKMVIPLSGPIIAVIGLYVGVAQWNGFFAAMIYLTDEKLFPLQLILRNILIQNVIDPTMIQSVDILRAKQGLANVLKFAVIVVSSLPVLLIYPFVQKYFVKGIMIGAIKG